MSSPTNPQHEPTMEEILASIRKIISEDQPEAAKPAAPAAAAPTPAAPAPAPTPAPTPMAAPEPQPEPELEPEPEVLELTQEIEEDVESVSAAPTPVHEPMPPLGDSNDVVFEAIDEPAPKASSGPISGDDLISPATHQAVGRALDSFEDEAKPAAKETQSFRAPGGSDVETVFTRAVQEAFEPMLHDWVGSNSDMILTKLKPLIREWMDENLPSLIEAAVENELRSRRRR